MTVTGIDYLTGAEVPVNDLRFLEVKDYSGDRRPDSSTMFPDLENSLVTFAGQFAKKYGVADTADPPILLTEESLRIIRTHYEESGGTIYDVNGRKAERSH